MVIKKSEEILYNETVFKLTIPLKARVSICFPVHLAIPNNLVKTHQDFKVGKAPMHQFLILAIFIKLLIKVNVLVNYHIPQNSPNT